MKADAFGQMMTSLNKIRRRLGEWFSRSEWAVKWLHLNCRDDADQRGVVVLQIDGLGRAELERALANGRMPFLRTLQREEDYTLATHYPGQPSTTPAVQGELFYGVRAAVPAFQFFDGQTHEERIMFDSNSVAAVTERLERAGEFLLRGGSSYANVYAGRGAEARCCAENLEPRSLLATANPVSLVILALLHITLVPRVLGYAAIELVLALLDAGRGIGHGENLGAELRFVPSRVGVCIVLREVVRHLVKMDVVRGLPIIYANFLGYDEQAHRRGPDSGFAHWSLRGIDATIEDIWHTAHRSGREYHLLVLSDHGQSAAVPYEERFGRSVRDAVRTCFGQPRPAAAAGSWRLRRAHSYLRRTARELSDGDADRLHVAATGPVGHIYFPEPPPSEDRPGMAERLAGDCGIPLVLYVDGDGVVRARTAAGEYVLPADWREVLGTDHPFPEATAQDLARVCHHRDAGHFVIVGWRRGVEPMTFAIENGSHGGTAPAEVQGFVLAPPELSLEPVDGVIRPLSVRRAIQRLQRTAPVPRAVAGDAPHLRVVTYNVHSCVGMDASAWPRRIARVLDRLDPDVIALQEVDHGRARTGGVDQLQIIADTLGFDSLFLPLIEAGNGRYGLALLANRPLSLVRREPFQAAAHGREPRGAMWVQVDVAGTTVNVFNTHFGLGPRERRRQAEALLGEGFLGDLPAAAPTVVCGDFNAGLRSAALRLLGQRLHNVQPLDGQRPASTWFGHRPFLCLDHILVSRDFRVAEVTVPRHRLARIASDHLPVCAELRLEG